VTADTPARRLDLARRPFHLALGALVAGLLSSTERPAVTAAASMALAVAVVIPRWWGVGTENATMLHELRLGLAGMAVVVVLLGAVVGDARLRALDAPGARVLDAHVEALRVHLLSPPRPNPLGASAVVEVVDGRLRGGRLLMRIARWTRLPTGIEVGAELAVDGHVRPLRPPEGAGEGFAGRLRGQGIAGELLLDHARATGRRRGGIAGMLDAMRRRAGRAVAAGLPASEAALARGMVLGQDEQIDETTRQDWRDSGLSHLLAVSGQNVMLLVALALPLLALGGLGRVARGVALLGLIAMYVPLAGAGPSLQRAGVMGAAGIAAMTLSRPASRWYALLLAAALTLALNPRASADPGWQLSFAAVAGILALGRPLAAALARAGDELLPAGSGRPARAKLLPQSSGRPARAVVRGLADAVALTTAATLATGPLVAFHFGAVPLAGLIANLLALPAVAPAMWLGMVKAALGIAGAALPPAAAAAERLGPVTRVPLAYLERLAERCAGIQGSRLELPLHSPLSVGIAYALIVLALLALRRASRRRSRWAAGAGYAERAAAWRRTPRSFRVAAVVLVLAVLVLATATGLGSPSPPGDLTVRFLDVGQGDATLVQDGHGANALFDAGPPEAAIYRELRAAGVKRLDLAVSTHQSRDHQGGFHELIRRMPIGLLLANGYGTRDPDYHRMLAEADAEGIRRIPAHAGEVLRVGRMTITVLGPEPQAPGEPAPDDPNPIGVAAIVSQGAFDLWLSADAESDAILDYPLRPVEAMKVSHHGSADPGLPELLDRLRPRLAAIEVGAHNSYGHPTPSTLAALKHAGVPTYRTDEDGTVTLTVTHGSMRVDTER
jgi:competence protein ComEC